jgi:tetratricopeptide (TPR) repeat protein
MPKYLIQLTALLTLAVSAVAQTSTRGILQPNQPGNPTIATGKTYAVVIGISHYEKVRSLEFADKDAELLADFLKSPLGGVDPANILLLTNQHATRAAIDDAVKNFMEPHAAPGNSLVFFIAGHGVYLKTEQDPVTGKLIEREPYILTYDSNPQDPKVTGYPMDEFRKMTAQQALRYGRVLVYADVCHAANIAGIAGGAELQDAVKKVMEGRAGDLGLLVASSGKNYAFESPVFGGGHGAFSYFLISGLNGSAAFSGAEALHWSELAHYVNDSVYRATNGKQSPRDVPSREDLLVLSDIHRPGIRMPPFQPMPKEELRDERNRQVYLPVVISGEAVPAGARGLNDVFEDAITRGKLLPEDFPSAYNLMLQRPAGSDSRREAERRLRIALEDQGQQIISRYLEGDQIPQVRDDFVRCQRVFEEAVKLDPGAQFDQSRGIFCQGRALIFERRYAEAEQLLTESIRLDPKHAYAWNAVGISKLEQVNRTTDTTAAEAAFAQAAAAFQNAIRFAPYWAYPVHNLALTLSERGDFDAAIREYRFAIDFAPQYSYLPYNLALLYDRLGDTANAQRWFETAGKTAEAWPRKQNGAWPEKAQVLNALGTLAAEKHSAARAKSYFEEAIANDARNPNARNNLALLLAGEKAYAEADKLWLSVLADTPEFITARVALAGSLAQRGDTAAAIAQYKEILIADPAWAGMHEALARLYYASGDNARALAELNPALTAAPSNPFLLELRGDTLSRMQRRGDAVADWTQALKLAPDRNATRRLSKKLADAHSRA